MQSIRIQPQPRRTMCDVRKDGYATAMYDKTDEITINGVLVRHYIGAQLKSLPNSAFESVWKEWMVNWEGDDWEYQYDVKANELYLTVDRMLSGPVLYNPAENCLYVFIQAFYRLKTPHWFSLTLPMGNQRKPTIKYLGEGCQIHYEMEDIFETHESTQLLSKSMDITPAPAQNRLTEDQVLRMRAQIEDLKRLRHSLGHIIMVLEETCGN